MGTVANAQQSGLGPLAQAIHGYRQQLDGIPVFNFIRSRTQKRSYLRQVLPK